ncbi:MAG: DUF4190 domain-containing protein [Verrucomicrobiota bacterium]
MWFHLAMVPPALPGDSMSPQPSTSSLAIWGFVMALLGFCLPLGLPAVVCGMLGLARIKKSNGSLVGKGFAISGIIIGCLSSIPWIVAVSSTHKKYCEIGARMAAEARAAETPFDVVDLPENPLPEFPALPDFSVLPGSGVRVCQVSVSESGPGGSMSFRVYLPAKEGMRGIPCVLVAPAGTNLMSGADLDPLTDRSYHKEALPYAEAGMAAILYSIDGPGERRATGEKVIDSYERFRDSGAGVINGRNAFYFACRRLPMIDPDAIFSAGHSSAGTLALLLAAHEPQLAGSLAYCGAPDVEKHLQEVIDDRGAFLFEGLRGFSRRSSPRTHLAHMNRPLFLFFSRDDSMRPIADGEKFIREAREAGVSVDVKIVEEGDHYQSMIREGIPAGIDWIRNQVASP